MIDLNQVILIISKIFTGSTLTERDFEKKITIIYDEQKFIHQLAVKIKEELEKPNNNKNLRT